MKTKLKDFISSNYFIFSIALGISILCYYFASIELLAFENNSKKSNLIFAKPELEFSSFFENNLQVTEREDYDFKYVEIKINGNPNNELKINIKDGFISIQSETKSVRKENKDNFNSYVAFSSSSSQIINVPDGVDEPRAEVINQNSSLITIKFPKKKLTI
jgi:HSP20 family molecular chaperone IbpA